MDRGVNPELGLTILRVVLGVIFIAHGAPSLFGGMEGTASLLESQGIPLPEAAAWVVSLLQFLGGLCLIAGFLVTPISLLLIVYVLMGIILVQAANGFYVVGPQASGGIEYNLLLGASLLMLVFGGPGLAAMDSRSGN